MKIRRKEIEFELDLFNGDTLTIRALMVEGHGIPQLFVISGKEKYELGIYCFKEEIQLRAWQWAAAKLAEAEWKD